MPSLLESLFTEKGGEKVSFQDVIERGLRVARGESFAPVDQPEEIQTEGGFQAFLKGLTRGAEKGIEGFKERIGFDPRISAIAPQRAAEPQFAEIENPTLLESLFESAGEFAPQMIGGVGIASPGVGALAGASEDILAGSDTPDVALGALGGGVGGFLGRFANRLGDPAVSRVLGDHTPTKSFAEGQLDRFNRSEIAETVKTRSAQANKVRSELPLAGVSREDFIKLNTIPEEVIAPDAPGDEVLSGIQRHLRERGLDVPPQAQKSFVKFKKEFKEAEQLVEEVSQEYVGIQKALSPEKAGAPRYDFSRLTDDPVLMDYRTRMGLVPEAKPRVFDFKGKGKKGFYPRSKSTYKGGSPEITMHLDSATQVIKKSLPKGKGWESRTKNALIEDLTVQQRFELADQLDKSVERSGLAIAKAICNVL